MARYTENDLTPEQKAERNDYHNAEQDFWQSEEGIALNKTWMLMDSLEVEEDKAKSILRAAQKSLDDVTKEHRAVKKLYESYKASVKHLMPVRPAWME